MYWDALKGKKLVVVDASVILKWVLPEEQEENVLEALSLRDAIVAGGALRCANVLYMSCHRTARGESELSRKR